MPPPSSPALVWFGTCKGRISVYKLGEKSNQGSAIGIDVGCKVFESVIFDPFECCSKDDLAWSVGDVELA